MRSSLLATFTSLGASKPRRTLLSLSFTTVITIRLSMTTFSPIFLVNTNMVASLKKSFGTQKRKKPMQLQTQSRIGLLTNGTSDERYSLSLVIRCGDCNIWNYRMQEQFFEGCKCQWVRTSALHAERRSSILLRSTRGEAK